VEDAAGDDAVGDDAAGLEEATALLDEGGVTGLDELGAAVDAIEDAGADGEFATALLDEGAKVGTIELEPGGLIQFAPDADTSGLGIPGPNLRKQRSVLAK
jgi:hypothetical protein